MAKKKKRFTIDEILSIRQDFESNMWDYKELGVKYKTTRAYIYQIIRRQRWKHI